MSLQGTSAHATWAELSTRSPPNWLVDFLAAVGDVALATVTLGFADGVTIRAATDIGSVDSNSVAYKIGFWSAVVASVGVGGVFAARAALGRTAGGTATTAEAYHYTFSRTVASIQREGLRAGSYATPNGSLTPLQAQIDLALAPNRGLRGALVRVDLVGLRQAGYEIPAVARVGRKWGMPGGGFEVQFPYRIPPEYITVIRQ